MINLEAKYKEFNERFFNSRLPEPNTNGFSIEWSTRMTRSAGMLHRKGGKRTIKLSTHYAQRFPEDVENVLAHEMIHLKHANHGPAFKREAERINREGGMQIKVYAEGRAKEGRWLYKCQNCGTQHERDKRLPHGGQNHRCRCSGKLIENKNKEERTMTETRTSGVFKMWNRLDEDREEFIGASKRIEVCVRDYKKFLERGKGPRKLRDIVEKLVNNRTCSQEEAIEAFEYEVIEQAEDAQEAKDRYLAGEQPAAQEPEAEPEAELEATEEESRDEKIMRLVAEGHSKTKVAEMVGVSRSTVNRVVNNA